ncbi:hypothetical protein CJD36_014700 [Flavipsychrobacter stenotrophus]|uniref:LamG domain-containing protein n=1 Tax=Flavipsychrobacter stenotrophus TaxID=2077091 RepID=A0A2S7STB9_9BACT|nr:LamG-like jellyroll fold domain-containing protein [Flavipsychrobacter stenotrophus]PQJ09948.1 hypothetical protein CJD36_014700 [Flavipsychrobacter stenotrophus]
MKRALMLLVSCVMCNLATAQNVPCYMPLSGLVAWYPFNGNANDRSGNELNGIVNGCTLTTDRFGHKNRAYYFDGTGTYINVPYLPLLDIPQATWNIWFKLVQPNNNAITGRFLWGCDPGIGKHITNYVYRDAVGYQVVYLDPRVTSLEAKQTLTDTSWHMFTTTYDALAGQMRIYQDGMYMGMQVFTRVKWLSGDLRFALSTDRYWQPFYGALDDASIHSRVLTAEEIYRLYRRARPSKRHRHR